MKPAAGLVPEKKNSIAEALTCLALPNEQAKPKKDEPSENADDMMALFESMAPSKRPEKEHSDGQHKQHKKHKRRSRSRSSSEERYRSKSHKNRNRSRSRDRNDRHRHRRSRSRENNTDRHRRHRRSRSTSRERSSHRNRSKSPHSRRGYAEKPPLVDPVVGQIYTGKVLA